MSHKQSPQEPEKERSNSDCPFCGGKDWVMSESDGMWYAQACGCRAQKIAQRMLRFADIPPAYADAELKNFTASVYRKPESKKIVIAACKIVKEYLGELEPLLESGMGLYIHSATKGSGKTRIAASIARELIDRGKVVKFATSTAILGEIKRTWDKGSEYTENTLLDQLIATDVLIIDDFGTENATDWAENKFYQIINERYIRNKATIYTSNEPLNTLDYDSRIVNRIQERSYQIQFPEESIREHIAEQNNKDMVGKIRKGE